VDFTTPTGKEFISSLDFANEEPLGAMALADDQDGVSLEVSKEYLVELPPPMREEEDATFPTDENDVTAGDEFAIVLVFETTEPEPPEDDGSTPGILHIVHTTIQAGLIMQRIRAVR